MLIDTHCHLHDSEWFTPDQQATFLTEAKASGVEQVVCIGTDPEDSANARNFAAAHAGVYWTYGIHPDFTNDGLLDNAYESCCSALIRDIKSASTRTAQSESPMRMGARADVSKETRNSSRMYDHPIAIGEIGLDYHCESYNRLAQISLFERMLQLAIDADLPVSLHIREAFPDALAVLDNFPGIRGVVHSFTGNKRELKQVLDRGFFIGVNGLATYSTLPLPPLDRILLETDAPFLTPVPFRGTINKPGYVSQIAAYLATKLGVTELKIAEQTTNNARQIFKFKQ